MTPPTPSEPVDRAERLAAYEAERRRAAEARIADRARRLAVERRRPRPDTAETEAP